MTDAPAIIGVDTGGTFTDVILGEADGGVHVHKLLSTPADPSEAIARGVAAVSVDADAGRLGHLGNAQLVHGTTVATNALLERDGADVAFVTTAGFEDLLELGRQNRPELYDFHIDRAAALVDADRCFGIDERLAYDGAVLQELDDHAVDALVAKLDDAGVEAVSVCLLHAYANPDHEKRVGRAIRQALAGIHVSLSHEILGEFREYERASTTAVNGFVGPSMAGYLGALRGRIDVERIEILQSSGGRCELDYAADFPVHTVLSGPAGGVVGGLSAAREVGIDRIITFDMGGTSTDVSLCDGDVSLTSRADIDGLPIHVPVVDIHTVGAGGGSVAYADAGGALRVGPRSAGARPGPACYGRGGQEPTVTDAHVCLGRVRPGRFLGGSMTLDRAASTSTVDKLADQLELGARQTARGVLEIADAKMARAVQVISLEQGYDPRDFCLVAFGGAGGMHACRLAARLGIRRVMVPRNPGLLSASGMLHADAQRLYSKSVLAPLDDSLAGASGANIPAELAELAERARADLGGRAGQVYLEWSVDLRYAGQSFEITVPVGWSADDPQLDDPTEAFEARHETLYGYRADERRVELVTIRLRAFVPPQVSVGNAFKVNDKSDPPDETAPNDQHDQPSVDHDEADIDFGGRTCRASVIDRADIGPGESVVGPAVICEYSATTLIPPDWRAQNRQGHLLLTRLAQTKADGQDT